MSLVLNDVAKFMTSKIEVSEINETNYISTENMISNKGGITIASSLPDTKSARKYLPKDILINNIRPYFKKIWYSDMEGGCSNDVFVIRSKENYDSKFLYYVLSSDDFFSYVMANAKGTKMPRGDKKAIQNYEVPNFSIDEQKRISFVLGEIDKKIEINKKINKNLTKLSSIIFINLMGKSNNFLELNRCCKFIKGKKPKETSDFPQSNFLDYLTIDVLSNQSQMYAHDEKGILANEYDILMVMDGASSGKLFYGKSGIVGSTLAKLNVEEKYLEIVYQFLKQSEKFISDNTTGSAIPHTDKGLVLSLKCPISEELLNYSDMFKSIRSSIIINNTEILKLQKLRDTLLPKLMSGEIDTSKINCDFENIAYFMIFSFKKIIGYLGLYFIRFL